MISTGAVKMTMKHNLLQVVLASIIVSFSITSDPLIFDDTMTVTWMKPLQVQGKFFSVHNTDQPLKLKICNVPYLCRPSIFDNGERCENWHYTDVWCEVELVPVKGESKRKHLKRKDPRETVATERQDVPNEDDIQTKDNDDVEAELPDIVLADCYDKEPADFVDLTAAKQLSQNNGSLFIDLTEGAENCEDFTTEPVEIDDIIIPDMNKKSTERCIIEDASKSLGAQQLKLYEGSVDVIPDQIYWESILGALEWCITMDELIKVASEL